MISVIATYLMTNTRLGPKAAAAVSWLAVLLIAFLALYLAYCWAWDRGRDHERAKWEAAAEMLEDTDAAADAEALDVAHDMKGTIETQNDRAKRAASKSDDPLRAALDEIKK